MYHSRRYRVLTDTLRRYYTPGMSIAIFGASSEYAIVKETFPSSTVTPYGSLICPQVVPITELKIIDLNESVNVSEHYDIGICCEVVEHLLRPVRDVVSDLLDCCTTVIVQTPNSMCLFNRLRLATTKSAWEHVWKQADNVGHLYEYTIDELTDGLPVVEANGFNYFGSPTLRRLSYNTICNILPITFRDGFTIVYRR